MDSDNIAPEFNHAKRLTELKDAPGAPLINWREIIAEVDSAFAQARTSEQRGALLAVFKSTMDCVEATLVKDDLPKFQEARSKQYKTFVVQEALIGENVSVDDLYAITQREVDAGRMAPDDTLRNGAVDQIKLPHLTREELQRQADGLPMFAESAPPPKPAGMWSKMCGLFARASQRRA